MTKKRLLKLKEAMTFYGVCASTLRLWGKNGAIPIQKTIGGHRRYVIYEDIPDEEAPPTEEDAALVAVKEEAAKQQKIEESIEKYVALEDKNSLLGRYLSSYCIPHELHEGLERPE